MKTMFKMLMVVFIFSSLNLLAQNDNSSDLKMKINDMIDQYAKACLAGDYKAIADFYTDDAISMPSYEPVTHGKTAILERNKKDFEGGTKYNTFSLQSTDISGNGDLAYQVGTYQVSLTMRDMKGAMDDHGKYLNVWQKQTDGSWKIKINTWNSDISPMSMNQAGAKPKSDNDK